MNRASWFRSTLFGAVAATAALAVPAISHADTITFLITSDHCSGTGGCLGTQTDLGTVQVSDVSGGAEVTITLADGSKFMNGGQDSTIGFNLTGTPTITAGNFSNSVFSLLENPAGSGHAVAGTVHDDGVGVFQYGILQNTGGGSGNAVAGPLTFDIFGTGVTAASFVSNGTSIFAIDVASGVTGNTGFVDASVQGTPRSVPGPVVGVGLPGLVAGCLGLIALARRRRNQIA